MSAESMRIRAATDADVDVIFKVHRNSVLTLCREEYSSDQLAMWLDGRNPSIYLDAVKNRSIWVAEDEREQIIGFVEIDGFEVTKLFVGGGDAFHGAGKQLLQRAVSQIAVSGAAKVYLEATLTAVKFYEKYGFRIVGQGVFSRGSNAMNLEIVKMELDFEGAALPVEKLIEE